MPENINTLAEQIRLEEELRQTKAHLNEIQHIAKLGSWELDLISNNLVWSDEIFNIFEIDKSKFDATYEAFLSSIHPDDRDMVNQAYTNSLSNRMPYEVTHRLRMNDGRIKWVREFCESDFDPNGKPIRSVGTVQDITEQKISELALRQSNRFLDAIVENIPVMIFIKRASDLRFELFNKAGEKLLGYSRNDLLGKSDYDFWPKEQANWFTSADRKVLASKETTEIPEEKINVAKGEERYLNTWKIALRDEGGEPTHLLGISIDITERKKAEMALQNSRQQYDRLVSNIPVGVYLLHTPKTGEPSFKYVNHQFSSLFGVTVEEIYRDSRVHHRAIHPDDLGGFVQMIQTMEPERRPFLWEGRTLVNGQVRWIRIESSPDPQTNGDCYWDGIVTDITERKNADLKQKIHHLVIETAQDGFWIFDTNGYLIEVNQAYADKMGYTRDELVGIHISELSVLSSTPEQVRVHIETIVKQGAQSQFETQHRHKEGHIVDFLTSNTYLVEQNCIYSFLHDITERRQIELDLQRVREMLHRHVLVREVHHRIKNSLQGVANLLQLQANESPEAGAAISKAIAKVRSIAVIHGLQGEGVNSQVALCDMVGAICSELQALTSQPLIMELLPHHVPVFLAETEQVPIALIVNELLFNAVKHSVTGQADQAIHITLQGGEHEMCLVIYSAHGQLPHDFDFNVGSGLGTGLALVKSLLPPAGAHLNIFNAGGGVRTELRLASPVLL